jgi:TolB protein
MRTRRAAALGFLVALIVVVFVLYHVVARTRATTSTHDSSLVPSRDAYIYMAKARGGELSAVAARAELPFDAEDPAWSPDGTRIAFTGTGCGGCGPAIYVLELREMRARRLASGSQPAWSRRGWIAFVRRGADGVDRLYLMRQSGRNMHALFRTEASGSQPSWSPDGSKIAFVRLVGDPQHGNPQIFVANTDGTGATDLAQDPSAVENAPAWSPDGKRIAFSTFGPHGHWELDVMRADGTDNRRLVALSGNVSGPSWSPEGERLVVMSDVTRQPGFPSLYIVQADESGLVRLTNASTEDFSPAWSPDGERIAFARRRLVRTVDHISPQ